MTADSDPALAAEGREVLCPRGRKAQLESSQLRPGWTTGACACVATTSASVALETGESPDLIGIVLLGGREAAFALTQWRLRPRLAMAAVTKDAGCDPDITHGAVVWVMVEPGEPGGGMRFAGGEGVGTVTLSGLLLPVGEPAINPKPREYITVNTTATAEHLGIAPSMRVTVSIDGGARIAEKTWSSRIGVLGGLGVPGTIGVVAPYSRSAWIASIHHGIDVVTATGATHAAVRIGSTSERVAEELHPGIELPDMGDFTGAVLKYLRKHPLPRLVIVGGVAKFSKLAVGYPDLHSHHTRVQPGHLRQLVEGAGASPELAEAIGEVVIVAHVVTLIGEVGINLPQLIVDSACNEALVVLDGASVEAEIVMTDRADRTFARAH